MAMKKPPRPPPVQQPLFEPVKPWDRPKKQEARRMRRRKCLLRSQLLLFEKIHIDRLMSKLIRNEVIFKTTVIGGKKVNVEEETGNHLASMRRMRGVDIDMLVDLLVEGKKGGLFIAQTQAQIVGIMKRGETIGKVRYTPVKPAARAEAENRMLNEALARIAMFVQRAVVAKLARERYGRAKLRLPTRGRWP